MPTTTTLSTSSEPVRARSDSLGKHIHLSWEDTSIRLSIEEAVDVLEAITGVFAQIEESKQLTEDHTRQIHVNAVAPVELDADPVERRTSADEYIARCQAVRAAQDAGGV